jgi:hypothetical protein
MALFTLRAAEQVRAAEFPGAEGEVDAEMVDRQSDHRAADRGVRSEHSQRPLLD